MTGHALPLLDLELVAAEVSYFLEDTPLASGDIEQIASAQEQQFESNLTYMIGMWHWK